MRRNGLSLLTAVAVALPTPQARAAGDGFGWVWAAQPVHRLGEWYRPNTDYQYSSPGAGRENQVRHDGPGTYTVYFDGVLRAGVGHVTAYRVAFKGLAPRGTVLVTATGPTAAWCGSGGDSIEQGLYLVARVVCFSPVDGSRADTEFDLTYAAGGSVVGDTAGTVSGYARATSRPSLPTEHQFPEPRWRLENPERGMWVLTPWQPIGWGVFQLTADDVEPTTCVTSYWNTSLTVQCYDRAGTPLNAGLFASCLAPRLSTTRDGGTP